MKKIAIATLAVILFVPAANAQVFVSLDKLRSAPSASVFAKTDSKPVELEFQPTVQNGSGYVYEGRNSPVRLVLSTPQFSVPSEAVEGRDGLLLFRLDTKKARRQLTDAEFYGKRISLLVAHDGAGLLVKSAIQLVPGEYLLWSDLGSFLFGVDKPIVNSK